MGPHGARLRAGREPSTVSSDAFQVLRDCPDCLVESAMVEFIDPAVAEGVAVEAWCRLCGRREALGELEHHGVRFLDAAHALGFLERWARAEGEEEAQAFCVANIGGLDTAEVARRLVAREPVHTSFDVVAFLFPGMGGGLASAAPPPEVAPEQRREAEGSEAVFAGPPAARGQRPVQERALLRADTVLDAIEEAHTQETDSWVPPDEVEVHAEDARAAVRALASVMLADGLIRPGERVFLDAFLHKAGLPPAEEAELRRWRPGEVPRPSDPEALVEAMIELAHVDRERDGSEWRVVREFARAWGLPLAEVEARGRRAEAATAPAMKRLWRALRRLVITDRA